MTDEKLLEILTCLASKSDLEALRKAIEAQKGGKAGKLDTSELEENLGGQIGAVTSRLRDMQAALARTSTVTKDDVEAATANAVKPLLTELRQVVQDLHKGRFEQTEQARVSPIRLLPTVAAGIAAFIGVFAALSFGSVGGRAGDAGTIAYMRNNPGVAECVRRANSDGRAYKCPEGVAQPQQ